jgi:transposase-like protein
MRRYIEGVKADVRRRMSPPHRQSVSQISAELGIHIDTPYNWRKTWRLQGEVVPESEKEPEGWSAADKFTVVLETAGLNATELSAYCRERGLYPAGLIQSVSQAFLQWLRAWGEVGGIAPSQCSKAVLPQPISL